VTKEAEGAPGTGSANPDRIAGITTFLVAVAIAWEGLTFSTTFPTDPLGPKAFPVLSAALLGLGGAWVMFRPAEPRTGRLPGAVWLGAASFVLYALLLEPIGFFVATLLEFVALSLLFGGRPLRSAVAGAAFVGALYLLFVQGLGLVLPVGSLFVLGS